MADIWFISDTHFFHENILGFKDQDGNLIRGQRFKTVNDMNVRMVHNWNSVVKPKDKVYHLGDVALGVKNQDEFTGLMKLLHGQKQLLIGNHDHIEQPAYREFERIELWTGGKFKQYGFVASHIPLRQDQMRDGEFNVHGHIHHNYVHWKDEPLIEDPAYINACVEVNDYTPIHLDEIRKIIASRM